VAHKKPVDVGHLAARLLSLKLPMGLVLDEVIIQGSDLQIGRDPFKVEMPEVGSLEVRLSEKSLADFLNQRAPGGLSGFEVKFAAGQIHVRAKASMIISLSVGAVCSLRIEDETNLIVDLVRMESIGGTGAHNLVQKQLDSINPIVRAKDFPVDVTFSSVEIGDQWLVLNGTISPRHE
jgi:hypothetical protein